MKKQSPKLLAVFLSLPVLILVIICCCLCFIFTIIPSQNFNIEVRDNLSTEVIPDPTVINEVYDYYKVLKVTDGDTIRLEIDGESTPLRLLSIDAPELSHPTKPTECFAKESKEYLEKLILNKEIRIEYDSNQGKYDRYDRLLGYIYLKDENGLFINEDLVRKGYAKTYTAINSDYKEQFLNIEKSIRNKNIGLWGDTCKCEKEEINRTCSSCNEAKVTFSEWDCSESFQTIPDNSCSSMCQNTTQELTPTQSVPTYTCNCSKTCAQMSSCSEAQYQLNVCGCAARDGDKDGVACDSDCQ